MGNEPPDDPLLEAVLAGEAPLAVYADWLEEQADPLATGFRWLARERRWPYTWSGHVYHMWFARESYPDLRDAPYFLPQRVYRLVDRDHRRNAADALEDAAVAYVTWSTGRVPIRRATDSRAVASP